MLLKSSEIPKEFVTCWSKVVKLLRKYWHFAEKGGSGQCLGGGGGGRRFLGLGCRFQVLGLVLCFRFRFQVQVLGFRFQVLDLRSQVLGFRFQVQVLDFVNMSLGISLLLGKLSMFPQEFHYFLCFSFRRPPPPLWFGPVGLWAGERASLRELVQPSTGLLMDGPGSWGLVRARQAS